MSALGRFVFSQSCRFLTKKHILRPAVFQQTCFISTSKKNKDTVAVSEVNNKLPAHENYKETDDNFLSYGYSITDRDEDRFTHHMTMLLTITLCICWGGFLLAYKPDPKMHEWAHREAYLLIAKRERDGLPHIDKNFLDPDTIELPTDEELGDTDIII